MHGHTDYGEIAALHPLYEYRGRALYAVCPRLVERLAGGYIGAYVGLGYILHGHLGCIMANVAALIGQYRNAGVYRVRFAGKLFQYAHGVLGVPGLADYFSVEPYYGVRADHTGAGFILLYGARLAKGKLLYKIPGLGKGYVLVGVAGYGGVIEAHKAEKLPAAGRLGSENKLHTFHLKKILKKSHIVEYHSLRPNANPEGISVTIYGNTFL